MTEMKKKLVENRKFAKIDAPGIKGWDLVMVWIFKKSRRSA